MKEITIEQLQKTAESLEMNVAELTPTLIEEYSIYKAVTAIDDGISTVMVFTLVFILFSFYLEKPVSKIFPTLLAGTFTLSLILKALLPLLTPHITLLQNIIP